MKYFPKLEHLKAMLLFMVLMVLSPLVFSQQASTDLPTYHPVSPNAASLGNFGLYPVNKNLGKLAVNIPVYNLSFKGLSVPINLSYNTSGIRLNDIASWVGLGWTLSAGGAIIRNTKGLPDKSFTWEITDLDDPVFNSTNYYYLRDASKRLADTEPDQFVFNALGISGSFYFNQNNGNTARFEDASMAININAVSNDEIRAILEDGTLLIFGKGSDNSDATELTDSNLDYYAINFVTTWYLTEVISSNQMDTVSFRYKENGAGTLHGEYAKPESERAIIDGSASPLLHVNYSWTRSRMERKFLDKIEYSNGYIQFESTLGREDLEDDFKLDAIKIYSVDEDDNAQLIDQYHFEYDYYVRSGGSFSTGYDSPNPIFDYTQQVKSREKSMRLIDLYRGSSANTRHKHQFHYNSTTLPRRCTTAQDFWGYCNSNTSTLLPSSTFYTRDNWATVSTTIGNGNRAVDESKMKAGILEKIIYPTGGYTLFDYEANRTSTDLVGGLRIKAISSYDAMSSSPASTKTFVYENPNLIQPFKNKGYSREYISASQFTHAVVSTSPYYNNNLGGEPVIEYGKVTEYDYDSINDKYNGKTISYYENILSTQVLHGAVTLELFEHDQYTISSSLINSLMADVLSGVEDMNYFETTSWKRGKLTKEEVYKMNGSSYQIIKSVDNTYETIESDTLFNNYISSPFETPYEYWTVPNPYNSSSDYSSIQYCYHVDKTILGRKVLKQSVVKTYDPSGNNPVTTTTDYFYDNPKHMQLTRTHTKDSDDERLISITSYPDDVTSTSSLTGGNLIWAEYSAISLLKDDGVHRAVNQPIQSELYKDYDDDGVADANEMLSIQRTIYKDWDASGGTLIQPERVASMTGVVSPTNQVEDRVLFLGYDSDGNPKEVSKSDDARSSYIWGYRKAYPVVKADNVIVATLETAVAAAINSLSGYSGGLNDLDALLTDIKGLNTQTKRDTWSSFNSNLRSQTSLDQAMVSTYTLNPQIGMTSQTNPAGITSYYNYDNFNRLMEVEDTDEKLVGYYEYNYKLVPELTVSPTSLSYTASASGKTAAITANQAWTASDNQSWISVSPTSGSDDTDITVSVSANGTSSTRNGTVTISDNSGLGLPSKTISISQAGIVASITLSDIMVELNGYGDYDQVDVTSNVSWTWYVDYFDDWGWLDITLNSGSGYNGTLEIEATDSPSSGYWEAEIVISGGGVTKYITVYVYY